MIRSLATRFVHALITLFAVSLLCFALLQATPGDYFTTLSLEPGLSVHTLNALRRQADPHASLLRRYAGWCGAMLHGDMGQSLAYHMPVRTLLAPRILNTLLLSTAGLASAWLLGLLLAGIPGRFAAIVHTGAAVLWSIPEPILAFLLLLAALRFHAMTLLALDASSPFDSIATASAFTRTIALPALAMMLGYLPLVLRHAQSGFLTARIAPAVEAAEVHGLPPRIVWLRYILSEAANPLISLFGLSIGSLLSASLFVEVLFGWPGLGPLLLNAILQRDTNVVVAGVFVSALVLMVGNLIADLLLWLHDPRMRQVSA
jgi:peptide/nickel transport system permease protein